MGRLLLPAAVLFVVLPSGCARPAQADSPLAGAEVASIEVAIDNRPDGGPLVESYTADRADHGRLVALVSGGTAEARPLKWQVLGAMKVTMADGRVVEVDLFWTGSGPGAYRIDKAYYRGPADAEVIGTIAECSARAKPGKDRRA